MRVRAIDSNGDWLFGKGQNDYKQGNAAIAQNVSTRLNSFFGDCFFDNGAGINWFNLLGGKDQTALNLAVTTTILNTDGITNLIQLGINVNPTTRRVTISYQAATVYSVYTSTVQLSLSAG
jgi:hypothetical protein